MIRVLTALLLLTTPLATLASETCVTGVKGTLTSAFIFKITELNSRERSLGVFNVNKDKIFESKVENRFVQFNRTGYGTCSLTGSGDDETSGAKFKVELKTDTHYRKDCDAVSVPSHIEFLSLKISPKGTTLGDDLTAYALTLVPCP